MLNRCELGKRRALGVATLSLPNCAPRVASLERERCAVRVASICFV
jgi:hypothetical protein